MIAQVISPLHHLQNSVIDADDLRTVASIRFGPVRAIRLMEPHHRSAFVDFETSGSAMRAMLASMPVRDGGDGGVLFGDQRSYSFEPRKANILELYRPTEEDRRKLEKFLIETEKEGAGQGDGRTPPAKKAEEVREAEWSYEDRKVFECPMYVPSTRARCVWLGLADLPLLPLPAAWSSC